MKNVSKSFSNSFAKGLGFYTGKLIIDVVATVVVRRLEKNEKFQQLCKNDKEIEKNKLKNKQPIGFRTEQMK